ncbi:MAG: ferritin-like domain-containing protein [Nitrospinae bacterium]|nr:ferritin-like domain-containing protein [Nitrospinota bacterium]
MKFNQSTRFLKDELAGCLEKVRECSVLFKEEDIKNYEVRELLENMEKRLDNYISKMDNLIQFDDEKYTIVQFLNEVLKMEYNGILDYTMYASLVKDPALASDLKKFGASEGMHALLVADMIKNLGGVPQFNPPKYRREKRLSVLEMLEEHKRGEVEAVELLERGMKRFSDPEFQYFIGKIRLDEQEHLKEVERLMKEYKELHAIIEVKDYRWRDDYAGDEKDRPWIE